MLLSVVIQSVPKLFHMSAKALRDFIFNTRSEHKLMYMKGVQRLTMVAEL